MNRNAPLDFAQSPPRPIGDLQYNVLVPQVDKDCNDVAGIRMPYLEVPLATHTGCASRLVLAAFAKGPQYLP